MAMVRAILDGERNPEKLAELCAKSVLKKKRQRLLEALEGTWKEEHIFALRQGLEGWEFYQSQIRDCDQRIATVLKTMSHAAQENKSGGGDDEAPRKRSGKNAPQIEGLGQHLKQIFGGADPGRLPGLSDYSALQLLGEVGADMSGWKSAKHFTSWLGLSPGKRQSGKSHRNQSRKGGRAGKIFRIVARSVGRSVNTALGAFYRRIKGARGGLVASKATGRKIAVLFYNLLTKGGEYVENGLAAYEKSYREQAAHRIAKTARKFGLQVTTTPPLQT